MNAHLTFQELNAYIHQTLNDAQRETLDAHLGACPACRAQLSELDALQQHVQRELVSELKAVNVPLSLTFETIAPKLQPPSRAVRLWHHSRQVLLGLTAAAALLMVVLTLAKPTSPTADQLGVRLVSATGRVGSWLIDSDEPSSYEFGIDRLVSRTGEASGFIRGKVDAPQGSGALMQQTAADSYRGKRIRLSAYIKTEEVERQAGLWLRIDRAQIQTLSFADMNDRPIQGTTDWHRYDLVLDVPHEATSISFAFFLMGRGQVWADDVQLEVVGQEVATTETKEALPLVQPTNLDFEAGWDGWLPDRNPQNYTTSIDTVNVHGGRASAHIQAKQANPISYAVLAQSVKADAYQSIRLRVTAYFKFEQNNTTAQLVASTFDASNVKQQDIRQPIDHAVSWQKQSLVFEVPGTSDHIVFGVTFEGEGQIWVDDVQVEMVGTDVALTQPELQTDSAVQPSKPLGQDLDQSFSDWIIAGTRPQDYAIGFDNEVVHTGKSSVYVKSVTPDTAGFGTFMTMVNAANYRGQRVRFAAHVKAEQVEWAGLWLRVDGSESTTLHFDNMLNRPIQGTRDWQEYEVVLDVPENSTRIAYGLILDGTGQVWLDNVRLQEVDQSVPTTDYESKPPTDLGFEIDDHSWAAPQENATPTSVPTAQALISATATPPARGDISTVQFGGLVTLVKPELIQEKSFPGEGVSLSLHWWTLDESNPTYTSFAHVLDGQGNVVAQADVPLGRARIRPDKPTSFKDFTSLDGQILLPYNLLPGQYTIAVGIYDNQSGQRLTTDQGETTTVIGTLEVVAPLARFGNGVALTDVELPTTQPVAGESLELSLHWMNTITNPATLNTFVHVIDSQGNLVAQMDQPLAPRVTSIQTPTLQLPSTMTAGDYQIVVGVYDPATGSRLTTDKGETQVSLTNIQSESKPPESVDTAHLHLVFAPEDRTSVARAAAQLEESFKQVCADLGCEKSEPTCTIVLDQEWCSPYSPSLTMTVFVRGSFEPMVWLIGDQLTVQVPSPRMSPFYAEGQPGILGRVSDLAPFVEKVAWPIFMQEPHRRGGAILYTAIVQWETLRLAQRLGQTSTPDPFRPDRLSTYPARALDALWNPNETVSSDLQTQDESVALITFIAEEYGDQAVAKLLNSIGNAPSLSQAIETSLGIQYSDFEQSWYDWLKQYRAD